jgi:formate/nitrite transporter
VQGPVESGVRGAGVVEPVFNRGRRGDSEWAWSESPLGDTQMTAKPPPEIAQTAVETGTAKARQSWDRVLVGSFLAGAYIAFGGLLGISVSSGLSPRIWGTLPTFFMGGAFTLGLILVVIAGSDLATGNMMLVPISAMYGRITLADVVRNLSLVLVGNLLGALFVAYFLAVKTGVIGHIGSEAGAPGALTYERLAGIAQTKGLRESAGQIFLRGVGCNWLVCLAVWMALAARDVAGKILAIFFPIMAFVAMGFDHVVANMFFLPAAEFVGVPNLGWGDVLWNWLFAFLGNLVGAVVFVSSAYWYMYLRGSPADELIRQRA